MQYHRTQPSQYHIQETLERRMLRASGLRRAAALRRIAAREAQEALAEAQEDAELAAWCARERRAQESYAREVHAEESAR